MQREGNGRWAENESFREVALRLNLPYAPMISGATVPAGLDEIREARCCRSEGAEGILYIAPAEEKLHEVAAWLESRPQLRRRVSVAPPGVIRSALIEASGSDLAERVVAELATHQPQFSARRVFSPAQAAIAILLVALVAVLFWLAWRLTTLVMTLAMGSLFLGIAVLRLIAAARLARFGRRKPVALPEVDDKDLPVYSVLVPLLREDRIVGDLVRALQSLAWPIDRLDVKLILEAGDTATRRAAERAVIGTPFEIIVVPPVAPLTKPKALAFALQFARGDLVTVYDAEDRPHPMQLREAHAAFRAAGPDLACLQAPLLIDNAHAGALARYFALEYAALFEGLLPALAALRMPLPLGGTSNHFRRESLEQSGGWDPFNVTEDADLGIRLARLGYRCDTITRPTWEEAPTAPKAWFKQRTRWFKGWLQTFLVHTRTPVALGRQLGLRNTIGFILVGIGMLVSAIIHPIYVFNALHTAFDPMSLWSGGLIEAAIVGLSLFNLVVGYYAAMLLSWRTMRLQARAHHHVLALLTLPIYWLLMSAACLAALCELVLRPHYWNKTPHRGRRPPALAHIRAPREPRRRVPAPAE